MSLAELPGWVKLLIFQRSQQTWPKLTRPDPTPCLHIIALKTPWWVASRQAVSYVPEQVIGHFGPSAPGRSKLSDLPASEWEASVILSHRSESELDSVQSAWDLMISSASSMWEASESSSSKASLTSSTSLGGRKTSDLKGHSNLCLPWPPHNRREREMYYIILYIYVWLYVILIRTITSSTFRFDMWANFLTWHLSWHLSWHGKVRLTMPRTRELASRAREERGERRSRWKKLPTNMG